MFKNKLSQITQSPATQSKITPFSQSQAQVPAPVLVTQDLDSIGDVPATPRAGSKKAPRQSKPSA